MQSRKSKEKKVKHSMEKYRFCPVPGCPSRKPLKKLPNHLRALHPELSGADRLKYLKSAKYTTKARSHPVQASSSSQPSLAVWFGGRASGKENVEQESFPGQQKSRTFQENQRGTPQKKATTRLYGRFSLTELFLQKYILTLSGFASWREQE